MRRAAADLEFAARNEPSGDAGELVEPDAIAEHSECCAAQARITEAATEARHAEREAMWRELRDLERGDWIEGKAMERVDAECRRIVELRRALGLEG